MIFKPLTNFQSEVPQDGAPERCLILVKPPIPRDDQAPQWCCRQEAEQKDNSTKTQLLVSH